MTLPVVPPVSIVVPVYPPLGSATFGIDAYTYATTMPSVSIRIGEQADATYTNALSAKESADIATAQAAASASAVGADKWVTGTNYPADVTAWSPTDKQTYRRNAPGGVSTTDPSLDTAGWTRVSGGDALPPFILMAQGVK
jgi:hypothetical protein